MAAGEWSDITAYSAHCAGSVRDSRAGWGHTWSWSREQLQLGRSREQDAGPAGQPAGGRQGGGGPAAGEDGAGGGPGG